MLPGIVSDLAASALAPEDLQIREAGAPELAATGAPQGAPGYVIPYFGIDGKRIAFYRVKLLNGADPKYRQPKGTANHLYFPPLLPKLSWNKQKVILITEGEKKAAAAVKHGIPAVGLGGVYSWKDRSLVLPEETILKSNKTRKVIQAKLPSTSTIVGEVATLAEGMTQLLDLIAQKQLTVIIVFDTDTHTGLKPDIQRAAAVLGYELRYRGIPSNNIRQLVLPSSGGKVGLDDYLLEHGAQKFKALITETLAARKAFPRYPNPRAYINSRLEKGQLTRREAQEVALAIVSELDARGQRLRSSASTMPYYFDEHTFSLMPAPLQHKHEDPMHESKFGEFLYREFGLSAGDTRVINWLAAQFTGEDPIEEVDPKRILATPNDDEDAVAYQLSDSHFAVISADKDAPITIHTNGSRGILFEQDQVEPIEAQDILDAYEEISQKPLKSWWWEVLQEVNLVSDEQKRLASLLYHISPFLRRYRGLQLPVEITTGEAGSGKSSLYQLRLSILTGRPILRNIPGDVRDWYTSITNSGGLHVIDNVQFTNKELRQRLSDEICRIITEPSPSVEMRKLYTTTGFVRIPVQTIFAFTAIQQPFHNADLIQRSATFEMFVSDREHSGNWVDDQLARFGGRTKWLAYHFVVLHKILQAAKSNWVDTSSKGHRLSHYEHTLNLTSQVTGVSLNDLSGTLKKGTQSVLSEADWALEGIKAFVQEHIKLDPKGRHTALDIAEWCQTEEEFKDNIQLTNSRRLGRYIQANKNMIANVCGLVDGGMYGNRNVFRMVKRTI